MHAIRVLEKWVERNLGFMHRVRARSVVAGVEGLLRGGRLTLSQVGRALGGRSRTKHKIKRVDRLLGNEHLHRERRRVYGALAEWVLGGVQRPVVVVDWSDCEAGREWVMLRAGLSVRGRAVTVYEEVHPLKRYNNPGVHREFLEALREVLPRGCCPMVVSDAGFRGPWFRAVEAMGWDWVGRVRNRVQVRRAGSEGWEYVKTLYGQASGRVRGLGWCELSKDNPYGAQLYLVKRVRGGVARVGKGRGSVAQRCRRGNREPWLLATSLPDEPGMGRRVVGLYAKRMQIEEAFRDLKDERWGMGLALARSHSAERREVLLLLATLATWLLWLVGQAAKARGWMRHYQANTERRRDVLSVVFLGREVLRQTHTVLPISALTQSLHWIHNELARQGQPA